MHTFLVLTPVCCIVGFNYMHEIKMMKLETDVIIAVSVEPVLDVVVAITSIVLVFKQCFDRDSF